MFVLGDKNDIPAILPTVFASTNVLFGLVGFYVADSFIRAGKLTNAHLSWILAYTGFAAILGFGYKRFLFAGNHVEFASNARAQYALLDWFSSDVFKALVAMSPIVLPAYLVPTTLWLSEGNAGWRLATLGKVRCVPGVCCCS